MTFHVFGSINIDHVYRLTHFPKGGETLVRNAYAVGLGGKGANQAMAAAKARAAVHSLLASLDAGLNLERAGRIASAAALCVTRARAGCGSELRGNRSVSF